MNNDGFAEKEIHGKLAGDFMYQMRQLDPGFFFP